MASEPKTSKGRARGVIRDVLNQDKYRDKLEQLVESAFELKRLAWAFCPHCGRKVQAEIPDTKGTVSVLVELLEQGEGKPGSEEGGVNIVVERPPLG